MSAPGATWWAKLRIFLRRSILDRQARGIVYQWSPRKRCCCDNQALVLQYPTSCANADQFPTDFVANEQETFRLTIDSVVQERPLRELYLRPFEIAIREANPWAVMSSYNLINGVHADMNEHNLKDILRGE